MVDPERVLEPWMTCRGVDLAAVAWQNTKISNRIADFSSKYSPSCFRFLSLLNSLVLIILKASGESYKNKMRMVNPRDSFDQYFTLICPWTPSCTSLIVSPIRSLELFNDKKRWLIKSDNISVSSICRPDWLPQTNEGATYNCRKFGDNCPQSSFKKCWVRFCSS